MSSLLNKETLIHIGIEVIIIGGITFYFYSQNKKLSDRIKSLENTIQNFEEQTLTQQKQINHLIRKMNTPKSTHSDGLPITPPVLTKHNTVNIKNKQKPIAPNTAHATTSVNSSEIHTVPKTSEIIEDNTSEDFDLDEDEMDDELVEELKDLEL